MLANVRLVAQFSPIAWNVHPLQNAPNASKPTLLGLINTATSAGPPLITAKNVMTKTLVQAATTDTTW
jgi:hypothetical protein